VRAEADTHVRQCVEHLACATRGEGRESVAASTVEGMEVGYRRSTTAAEESRFYCCCCCSGGGGGGVAAVRTAVGRRVGGGLVGMEAWSRV
jgi:hypothetical protein